MWTVTAMNFLNGQWKQAVHATGLTYEEAMDMEADLLFVYDKVVVESEVEEGEAV